MCERPGELNCPFVAKTESGHYHCDLPGAADTLAKDYLNQYCLRPHCRKCPNYQAFEQQNFPLFNPKNRP